MCTLTYSLLIILFLFFIKILFPPQVSLFMKDESVSPVMQINMQIQLAVSGLDLNYMEKATLNVCPSLAKLSILFELDILLKAALEILKASPFSIFRHFKLRRSLTSVTTLKP